MIKPHKINVTPRLWRYACSRLGMKSFELAQAIGMNQYMTYSNKLWLSSVMALSYLLELKVGINFEQLIVESETVLSSGEAAEILGVGTHRIHKILKSRNVQPVTVKPFLFINYVDLPALMGFKPIADLMRDNPIYKWRRDNSVPVKRFCTMMGCGTSRLATLECGNDLPNESERRKLRKICGSEIIEELREWVQVYRVKLIEKTKEAAQ